MGTIVLIIASVIVAYFIKKSLTKLPGDEYLPPTLSGWIPWIGYGVEFGKNPLKLLETFGNKYEVFAMKMFGETMTFVNSPDTIEQYFSSPESELSAYRAYRFTVPVFGPGVVYDAKPEDLVEQRQ